MSNLGGTYMEVKIDEVFPNPWNPNQMNDEMFNRLADEIEEVGFINPIQIVPMEDGTYRIIGGEHRWRTAKTLGYEEVPAIVLDGEKWKDEDLQKFVTTRLNAISGNLNPERFMNLYQELSEKYDHENLQILMGFTDKDFFDKMTRQARKGLEDAGVSKDKLAEFDEVAKEIKTVEDLSNIINKIFSEHGNELQHNFMWFGYGGQEHLYISVDKPTYSKLKALMGIVQSEKADAAKLFGDFIHNELKSRTM